MSDLSIGGFIAGLPGLIMALSLHEYAHAWMAVKMGDDTPKNMGRLTINPFAHIDPLGFLMLVVARFGWAKPVMIDPRNFRDRRKGEILVAGAGPAMNFFVAFVSLSFFVFLTHTLGIELSDGAKTVLSMIVLYNVNFGVFNLIPIPPLDGSRILKEFLPQWFRDRYERFAPFGFIILIVLIMTPAIRHILIPASSFILKAFAVVLTFVL